MWIFETCMPDGMKYTKKCRNEDEAMREMRWAKGRSLYDNCSMRIFEAEEGVEEKKPSLFE
jgi:hypothetical protein